MMAAAWREWPPGSSLMLPMQRAMRTAEGSLAASFPAGPVMGRPGLAVSCRYGGASHGRQSAGKPGIHPRPWRMLPRTAKSGGGAPSMSTASMKPEVDRNVPACLAATAALTMPGQGQLTVGESLGTIGRRFTPLGTEAILDTCAVERGKASPFQGDRQCWSN